MNKLYPRRNQKIIHFNILSYFGVIYPPLQNAEPASRNTVSSFFLCLVLSIIFFPKKKINSCVFFFFSMFFFVYWWHVSRRWSANEGRSRRFGIFNPEKNNKQIKQTEARNVLRQFHASFTAAVSSRQTEP